MRYKHFELNSHVFICLESQYDFIGKFFKESPHTTKVLFEEIASQNCIIDSKTLVVLCKHVLFRKPKVVAKTDRVMDMYLYSTIFEIAHDPISIDGQPNETINRISLVLKGGQQKFLALF